MNTLKKLLARTICVVAILAAALSVTAVQAAVPSPFLGKWEALDVDGSSMNLAIGGHPGGPFQITWGDNYISVCDGGAGITKGTGYLNANDANLLEADMHLECFTTPNSLDFHVTWRYHPLTSTLSTRYSFGQLTIWYRPGRSPAMPAPLNLRVNYGHDWVESFYEPDHMVWVTVTDAEGNLKASAEATTDESGYFQMQPEDWLPSQPDIQPYDWIYGWVDNGATAQLQIGAVDGTIDLANDSVTGTVYVPWFSDEVQIECHPWGASMPEEILKFDWVQPNGADEYSCSWAGEWDIQPGQNVGVAYFTPDGHWVANAFYVPRLNLRVNYGHDWVESFYEADHTVWITVTDEAGNLKATATAFTGPDGYFQIQPEQWNPGHPDIQPYDWVSGHADDGATAEVQIGEIKGSIDLANDLITGTVYTPWFSDPVEVDCHSWGAPFPEEILKYDWVQPDGQDQYACSWAGEWDIQPGQIVGAGYTGSDGHWVANYFTAPNPNLYALPDNNQIFAQEWVAGFPLDLKIYDSDGNEIHSDSQMVMPPSEVPWTVVVFSGFDLLPQHRIVLNQRGYERELLVSSLRITAFDYASQQILGVGDPYAEIFIRINGEDVWGQVGEDGNWAISHPQLVPGVWGEAIQPDGVDGDETRDGFMAPYE